MLIAVYKRVIDLRRSVQANQTSRKKEGADEAQVKRLESEQLALKILANATSYGIFIELNVDDPDETFGVARRQFKHQPVDLTTLDALRLLSNQVIMPAGAIAGEPKFSEAEDRLALALEDFEARSVSGLGGFARLSRRLR